MYVRRDWTGAVWLSGRRGWECRSSNCHSTMIPDESISGSISCGVASFRDDRMVDVAGHATCDPVYSDAQDLLDEEVYLVKTFMDGISTSL
jgi:hypothetical protein